MAQIREELTLVDKFTAQFTKFIRLSENASNSANDMRYSLNNIETATAATAVSIDRLADEIRSMSNHTSQASRQTDVLAQKIKQLVGAYVGIQGIRKVLDLSDTLIATTARLDMMNDGLQDTAELQDMIYQSAQRSRGLYTDTAAFVAKLSTLAGSAFDSNQEIIAFAEQINKQMALSGTTTQEAQAAMLQLTQGLSSGVLRGEELNSVLEQTPMIAQSIAKYMGVTTGEMRELASEGKVTAEVVKNAMFAAAEETDAKFAEMPVTWGQLWTQAQNILLKTFQPVLNVVGQLAGFISEHMDTAIAVFYGLAAAVAFYTVAQWIATGAAKAFFAALLANPILLAVAVAIGIVIVLIYKWVQAVGGLKVAWLIVVDAILFAWDTLKAGFMTGVYAVMGYLENMALKFLAVKTSIQNFMGDMKVGVLNILQSMVNGAIGIINWFIEKLNLIPGVSIDAIQKTTFAATTAAENEAAKAARNKELEAARAEADRRAQSRADQLAQMWADRDANHAARQAEIQQKRAEQAAGETTAAAYSSYDEISGQLGGIASGVKGIEKAVNMSEEDLKSLVDVAERRYVNQVNLTAQTPVITINGANTGRTAADRQNLADAIRDILVEQAAAGAVRSTAGAY